MKRTLIGSHDLRLGVGTNLEFLNKATTVRDHSIATSTQCLVLSDLRTYSPEVFYGKIYTIYLNTSLRAIAEANNSIGRSHGDYPNSRKPDNANVYEQSTQ
jgi:hypothetical protein